MVLIAIISAKNPQHFSSLQRFSVAGVRRFVVQLNGNFDFFLQSYCQNTRVYVVVFVERSNKLYNLYFNNKRDFYIGRKAN